MKQLYLAGSFAAALALAGCSSVDQVPLVYVSTTKVGVAVESGSTETPGASLVIGVDLTDAAYVPVAVSRHCAGDTVEMMTLCAEELKEITLINGSSDSLTENDKSRIAQLAEDANALGEKMIRTAGEYSTALSNQAVAQADLRAAEAAGNQVALLEAKKKSFEDQAEFTEQGLLDDSKNIFGKLDEKKRALVNAERDVKTASEVLDTDKKKLRSLTDEFLSLIPNKNGTSLGQRDAFSVFGTFSGDISGKAGPETGSSVRLGKSFSTGIAAQHLARGVADREKVAAEKRSECVSAVTNGFAALPQAERNVETYQKLLARCDA